jgi:hypothetical protein
MQAAAKGQRALMVRCALRRATPPCVAVLPVRALMCDDLLQFRVAERVLREVTAIALALPCQCELVWALRWACRLKTPVLVLAFRSLRDSSVVLVKRPPAEAGGFAGGGFAYEGAWLGAEKFVSVDRQAVALLVKQGVNAVQLES